MRSPDVYPVRRDVPWRVLDTEALVVDVKSGLLYPLNTVATRIWELCDGAHSLEDIVRALTDEFDADAPAIRDDAVRFIAELAAANLVMTAPGPAPAGRPRRPREETEP